MLLFVFIFRKKGSLISLDQLARIQEFISRYKFSFLFSGNTFSSLSGMTFEWSIAKDDDIESLELSSKVRYLY